jgi:excisionase family DNA binding protein
MCPTIHEEVSPGGGQIAHAIADVVSKAPISRTSVYIAIKEGRLKARKLGRRTLILDEDLRSWLASLPTVGG